MQIARWGNSLAVRLPVELVRKLGLKEGDSIDVVAEEGALTETEVKFAKANFSVEGLL